MKKTLFILSMLLLGLVSCNKTEFDIDKPKAEETGLVAITMKVEMPAVLEAYTKAGEFAHNPNIDAIRVAVFGTSGYPQAYALAEPITSATDETPSSYATVNGQVYYFKVLLPVYEGEAHVHIIANGPESIKFVEETETSLMESMSTTDGVGAYWARVVLPDGILTEKDSDGIMKTDQQGNFIPSPETAHLFEDLVLVRNFAEVKLTNESSDISSITWTLVNVPTNGSVAPMAAGTYVDNYKDYTYDPNDGLMKHTDGSVYDGFIFPDAMDYDYPADTDIATAAESSSFMYERPNPGTDKASCLLVKAKFRTDDYFTYYRLDLQDEAVGGYFPIYRNYMYQVKIHKVGNRGAKTIDEAMLRNSGGNVSMSTEARKLTDISDGTSRLYVEYVEKNFTSGGTKGLWVQYIPDITTNTVDNTNVTVKVKTKGNALKTLEEGATLTPIAGSSASKYYFYEFELNGQDENEDLESVLQVVATNGKTDDDKSTLYRDITLRVLKKMDMSLTLVPKKISTSDPLGTVTDLGIHLPDSLPESMFPLEFYIEDVNRTLNPTQKDGDGNAITVPAKTGKSLVDGTTNSFYFIRTVNKSEYDKASNIYTSETDGKKYHQITTEFQTINTASATTIYVANEYFTTQHVNLLNDGIYVNPTSQVVNFNVTSAEIEVEAYVEEGQTAPTWTVTAGTGVTLVAGDNTTLSGNTITGTGTGKFTMEFAENTSTTDRVDRKATVTCDGNNHPVTITQKPLEFSITPETQTVLFNATTTTVKINAAEGYAWTASITGPEGVTGYSLSETTGTGSKTLTVTLPKNTATSQRTFNIAVELDDREASASATITQTRTPIGTATFSATSGLTYNGTNRTGAGTSTDEYVSISLSNIGNDDADYWSYYNYGPDSDGYIQMGYRAWQQSGYNWYQVTYIGSITITPVEGIKITGITVTYSNGTYGSYDTDYNPSVTVSSGNYSRSGATGTWTGSSTEAVTFTNGYRQAYGGYYFPRITAITVTYAAE